MQTLCCIILMCLYSHSRMSFRHRRGEMGVIDIMTVLNDRSGWRYCVVRCYSMLLLIDNITRKRYELWVSYSSSNDLFCYGYTNDMLIYLWLDYGMVWYGMVWYDTRYNNNDNNNDNNHVESTTSIVGYTNTKTSFWIFTTSLHYITFHVPHHQSATILR